MPEIITTSLRFLTERKDRRLLLLYVSLLLLSLHWAVVIYINSSYLAQFVSGTGVSTLYVVGSLLSLVLFFHTPLILRSVGNYKLTLTFTLLEIVAVLGMAFAATPPTAIFFFLLHFILVPLILFNLDIFIEEVIGPKETTTGSKRGLYLMLLSLATAAGPLLTGHITAGDPTSLSIAYALSALFLVPFLMIVGIYFKKFKDPQYTILSTPSMLEIFRTHKETRNIVIISTHLQLFFIWMVIYTPLYLANVVKFSLLEIGLIMFVGLFAYVIFEYPIGIVADKYIGEKEMMAFGFVFMAISTSWFAFLPEANIGVWMFAMFLTRVGASFVETTSESYFFKHAGAIDAHKISLFRMTRPLASLIGALLGGVALLYIEFNLLFVLLALLMIPGLFFTLLLKDTR